MSATGAPTTSLPRSARGAADSPAPTPSLGGPREILRSVVYRLLHPRPVVLETRRPIEVPVLTEVKLRWQRGEREEAIRYGYNAVLADLQRAFGVAFPEDWTHEDILERGVTEEMVPIPELLHRFLSVFAPVRYGGPPSAELPSPEPWLQSIYAHPRMWGLYLNEVARPDLEPSTAGRATTADTTPGGPTP